jgi:hypothetical protein
MVHRQNKSLKRLAKTMNDTLQNVRESPLKSNTEVMIDIIKQIKKVPVAEARAVIAGGKRNNPSRVIAPTPSARDSLSMQIPRNIRLGDTRLPSGSRFPSVRALPHSQETLHQVVTASRQRRRTRDYGDGNREHYEGGSSSSSIRNSRHNNHMLFAPNPPFIQEDWVTRNRNKTDS